MSIGFKSSYALFGLSRPGMFFKIFFDSTGRTVYPKKYAHGFVVLCFVVVMQSFIMNSHEVFIHIHQGCFAGTGAIVRLPQCQWSKPDGYGKISQCLTTTKHSKSVTVCIFLAIYCNASESKITSVFSLPSHLCVRILRHVTLWCFKLLRRFFGVILFMNVGALLLRLYK